MKIAMIGTGYVGLVSGVCFSDFGHDVVCVDISLEKTATLNAGEVLIYEPGLDVVMARNVAGGRYRFSTDTTTAVDGADAVGTPTRRGDGHADLVAHDYFIPRGANAMRGFGKADHVLYDLKNVLGTQESDLRL